MAAVTLRAFTKGAMLVRMDRDLPAERDFVERQPAEDSRGDAHRLERVETGIRAMRDLMLRAFRRGRTD
jgi:hypothetical protein